MKGREKDPKRRIKKQNAEKISWFFIYSYSFKKKGKREGQGHSKQLEFYFFSFYYFATHNELQAE